MLIIGFLRNKHLFQLQVQAFHATPQPWRESVEWQQGHRLHKQSNVDKRRVCFFVFLEILSLYTCAKTQKLKETMLSISRVKPTKFSPHVLLLVVLDPPHRQLLQGHKHIYTYWALFHYKHWFGSIMASSDSPALWVKICSLTHDFRLSVTSCQGPWSSDGTSFLFPCRWALPSLSVGRQYAMRGNSREPLSVVSSKNKRAVGYLSDACCMTCWQGGVGELISCWGRGVTGALLQLVPQFGHLRAERGEKYSVHLG